MAIAKTPESLVVEAIVMHNAMTRRKKALENVDSEPLAAEMPTYLKLNRIVCKSWSRYLRRWLAQDDVQWFEPWLPQRKKGKGNG